MSRSRIIRAEEALKRQIEAYPYMTAVMPPPMPEEEGPDEVEGPPDEMPVASAYTTAEEAAMRLAETESLVQEKLQNAEREAQDIARMAYEEGFAAGEREGREFGEAQFRVALQRLDGHLQELSQAAALVGKAAEDELVAMMMAMAEYLAAQQLDRTPQSILPLLESVLNAHPFPTADPARPGAEALLVYLSPRDQEELGDRFIGYPGLRLVEDPELSRGSLRIEAPDGVLEATFERRRERLIDQIYRFFEKERL